MIKMVSTLIKCIGISLCIAFLTTACASSCFRRTAASQVAKKFVNNRMTPTSSAQTFNLKQIVTNEGTYWQVDYQFPKSLKGRILGGTPHLRVNKKNCQITKFIRSQ